MAPSYEQLREADLDDDEFDEDEVDVSDLREKYEVQLDSGYDTFVVIDGLPSVTEEQKPKLVKFLLKKLNSVGRTREDQIYMPMGDDGKSQRYVLAVDTTLCHLSAGECMFPNRPFPTDLPSSSTRLLARPPLLADSWTWFPSTRGTPFA